MQRIATSFFGAIVIVAMALPTYAQQGAPVRVALPRGPARQVILKSCTKCHGLDEYATRALDRQGWQKEIDSMKLKGATISDQDAQILLDYLVNTFGPNFVPAGRVRTAAPNPAADAKATQILNTACTKCHTLQRVEAGAQSQEDWTNILRQMKDRGAAVTDEDVTVLVEYLTRTHGPN